MPVLGRGDVVLCEERMEKVKVVLGGGRMELHSFPPLPSPPVDIAAPHRCQLQ